LAKTSRLYKKTVHSLLLEQQGHVPEISSVPKTSSLTLTLYFYFRTFLKRDLDGGLKIVQDGICEALGLNDNRIHEIHLYKYVDRQNPHVACELTIG